MGSECRAVGVMTSAAGLAVVAALVALIMTTAGCAGPGGAVAPRKPDRTAFATPDQRIIACLDLRDHIVALYTDDYLARERVAMSERERSAFRDAWAEELAKRGTFDRFEQACFSSLTPSKYRCGMGSQTTDGLTRCMQTG